jgi:hypothetical protein
MLCFRNALLLVMLCLGNALFWLSFALVMLCLGHAVFLSCFALVMLCFGCCARLGLAWLRLALL